MPGKTAIVDRYNNAVVRSYREAIKDNRVVAAMLLLHIASKYAPNFVKEAQLRDFREQAKATKTEINFLAITLSIEDVARLKVELEIKFPPVSTSIPVVVMDSDHTAVVEELPFLH